MRKMYLIVLVALVLGSCKKEDPVEPDIVVEPPTVEPGKVTFYITSVDAKNLDFPLTILIDSVAHYVKITGSASSGVNCDQPLPFGVRVHLDPGTYGWRVIDEDSWSDKGTITILSEVCQTQRLLP